MSTGFAGAPRVDGKLLLDAASRTRDRTDHGTIVFRTPAAVLQPGSVRDIQATARFCRRCAIKVAARGADTQVVDTQVAALQLTGWDDLVKPWFDVWLPEATAEAYVTDVLSHLTPEDIAPTGFILLFAQRRSKLTRPFLRVPPAEHGEWVYLFDILNASLLPGPNPGYARKMLDRNRRWFERARDAGGTRYPIGSLEFSRDDWKRHYGEQWPRLRRIKRRYDPDGVLTPGPGIF